MKELYLELQNGAVKIEDEIIKKYDIKRGAMSPFTRNRIVDENGDFTLDMSLQEDNNGLAHISEEEQRKISNGIVELDNGIMLSTSEMIDIAQGVDSSTGET